MFYNCDKQKLSPKSAYQITRGLRAFEEDKLFATLCFLGYPSAKAFKIAYPESKANASSACTIASRKLQDKGVQLVLGELLRYAQDCNIQVNESAFKGWTRQFRRKKFYI